MNEAVTKTPKQIREEREYREYRDSMIGWAAGILIFIGTWIFCMAHYGFLLGVGLGWLPSAIVAAIGGVAVRYLWPLAVFFGAIWLLYALFGR